MPHSASVPESVNSVQCNDCFCCQGGEESDPSAKAAAGRGLSGLPPCRPGEGPKEKGGAGAAQARGGEGPTECSCRGAETKSESYFPFML